MHKKQCNVLFLTAVAVHLITPYQQAFGGGSLLIKPAFELTEKDQVLLDILHQKEVLSQVDVGTIEEINGAYSDVIEQSYQQYLEKRDFDYVEAVQTAAKYLVQTVTHQHKGNSDQEAVSKSIQRGDWVSLLIGINYEKTSSELSNCILDVQHVFDHFLKPRLGIQEDHRILMTDHAKGTELYPTKKNIYKQLANFVNLANKTKFGYVHYSGHGSSVKDTSGDELDHQDEALVPVDYDRSGFIIDDDMYLRLVKMLQSDVHLIVTTDCCHSGTILDLPYKWSADGSYTIEHRLSSQELTSLPKVIMLSGCRDAQTSADGGPITVSNEGSGALTGAFLQVLDKHHYEISYRQLLVEVNALLKDNGFAQRPQLTSTYLLNLDDPYVVPSVRYVEAQ